MKKLIIFIFLISSCSILIAQDDQKQTGKGTKAGFGVSVVQVQPEYPGGPDSLASFLNNNLTYPDSARRNHVQGKVYVGFMIDTKGKIVNPKILSSVATDIDNEALRVVRLMPDWKPGTAGGTPVKVQYILPIDFITPPASIQK